MEHRSDTDANRITPRDPDPQAKFGAEVFAGTAGRLLPAALLGLGIRKLLTAAFIPGWQPVHPGPHTLLASVDAIALIALAALAIAGPWRAIAFRGLAALLASWIVLLQLPILASAPTSVVLWLGVAEVGALVSASAMLAAAVRDTRPISGWERAAFVGYGMCAVVFGVSHFAYADFTATMVPAWLPARHALAYFTGAAHVAAGLAIASGVLRRIAASLLTCMMATFVLLVHVPAVLATSGSLTDITFLLNACALCGSALAVASISSDRRSATEEEGEWGLSEPVS